MNLPFRTDKVAQQIAVKSAVNPSLWSCVTISIPLFVLSANTDGWLSVACFVIAIIPILIFGYSYLYFMYKDPEYLRSEQYQLRMNSMRFMGDKDNPEIDLSKEVTSFGNNPSLPKPKSTQKQLT